MLRILLALVLAMHGVAHLVGFSSAWRLSAPASRQYRTTLLAGHVDVGEAGMRLLGFVWLATAILFWAAAIGALSATGWWVPLTLGAAFVSMVLSATEWPEAGLGILVNLAIVALIGFGQGGGWLRPF